MDGDTAYRVLGGSPSWFVDALAVHRPLCQPSVRQIELLIH
jgi:hypothetical protein